MVETQLIYMARDIHGREDYLKLFIREAEKKRATLLDIGGDLTNFGDRETQRKIESCITSDIPVILTRGNHDHINMGKNTFYFLHSLKPIFSPP